jgi:broad specificity phosphatase PhoE
MTSEAKMVRGQADGSLTPAGRSEANRLAENIRRKGGFTCMYLSTAQRVRETVNAIKSKNPELDVEEPVDDILSWRLGGLEGEPLVEAQPKIDAYVRWLPSESPEGKSDLTGKTGESFDDFRWRALPYIAKQIAEYCNNRKLKLAICTHSRVVKLVEAWLAGGMQPLFSIDFKAFLSPAELGKPGSVWRLKPGRTPESPWTMVTCDMLSNERFEPGVYIMRHASTRFNSV